MYNLRVNQAKKRICVITCYKHPDYVRGEVIRQAVQLNPNLELVSIKNNQKSLLRYPEIILKLIGTRFTKRPDAYLVTFRGYEILPVTRLITIGRPLIFDEFINLVEWTVYEHKKIKAGSFWAKLLNRSYSFWLKRTRIILTDTASHAKYSSELTGIPIEKYKVIPVGADEQVFKPSKAVKKKSVNCEVLYYGNMLPLHGAEYVLEAAVKLSVRKDLHFTLIGGKKEMLDKVAEAKRQGANIRYIDWVPLKKLPTYIERSDLCLGGPFGNTLQSGMVITGKTYQFMVMSKPTLIGKNIESVVFKDKEDCLIVKQADANDMARALEWAADNPGHLARIGKNGNKLYQEKFSLEKISAKLSDLLG